MPIKQQGRIAGGVYLSVVLAGIFALAYAPKKLFISADSQQVLSHLYTEQPLLIAQIVGMLAMSACFLLLPLALGRFLSPWGHRLTRLMILCVAMSLPPTLLAAIHFAQLAIALASETATAVDVASARAGYRQWIGVATVFWGLWLAPLGLLIIRSGALPRLLGVLLLLGSAGYLVDTACRFFVADYASWPAAGWVTLPASIGELGTCAWLLVFGARDCTLRTICPDLTG